MKKSSYKVVGFVATIPAFLWLNSEILGLSPKVTEDIFYKDLFENSEEYELYSSHSSNFGSIRSIDKNIELILINCLKTEGRTASNLGQSDSVTWSTKIDQPS